MGQAQGLEVRLLVERRVRMELMPALGLCLGSLSEFVLRLHQSRLDAGEAVPKHTTGHVIRSL